PLTNFIFFIGAIGFSVVIQHPLYLAASCIGAASYYLLLNGRNGWKLILGMIPLFLLVAGTNPLFNTYGETLLFTVLGRPYTLEALFYGMTLGGMLVVMMLWFGCYSAVLTSDKFVCLFGSLIPSLSMLLVMVLRMIPNLMRKARLLSEARKSIGKGVSEQSSNREKLHDGMNILSALTDWALEGSIVTADSMRARGYGAAKRTSFQIYHLTLRDGALIALMLSLALLTILPGGTTATFTPEFFISSPTWGLATYFIYLMLPCAVHLKEAVQWHSSISKI
ncbi:MAG: energy-coupling factor transporter transmembrane protein EcfT, partial [Oscillospiraceae bacterium]|nr:energy-coupling factor transporter transmembrane protein EcfT [Oscillospiraceae bacterium]